MVLLVFVHTVTALIQAALDYWPPPYFLCQKLIFISVLFGNLKAQNIVSAACIGAFTVEQLVIYLQEILAVVVEQLMILYR